jgi:hypothetical protein
VPLQGSAAGPSPAALRGRFRAAGRELAAMGQSPPRARGCEGQAIVVRQPPQRPPTGADPAP